MKTGFLKLFVLGGVVALAVGCNPVYKKNTILIPPKSEAGLLCVKSCNSEKHMCNQQCLDRYEQCKAGMTNEIQSQFRRQTEIYLSELEQHDRSMRLYNISYNKYLSQKTQYQNQYNHAKAACDNRDESACNEAKVIERTLEDLRNNYYGDNGPLAAEPQKPKKPIFSEFANELVNKRCSQTCNCDMNFQQCFAQCGGTIKHELICVENCKK